MGEISTKPLTSIGTSRPGQVLTKKQKLFVEAYAGDEVVAMQIAGYEGSPNYLRHQAKKLLKKPGVIKALQDRTRYLVNLGTAIADRDERMMMWSSIMNNHDPHKRQEFDANGVPLPEGNIPLSVRLKASELLGKAEGDFITQVDINHNVTVSDIIQQSYQVKDKPIEVIEAEYMELREKKKEDDAQDNKPESLEDFL